MRSRVRTCSTRTHCVTRRMRASSRLADCRPTPPTPPTTTAVGHTAATGTVSTVAHGVAPGAAASHDGATAGRAAELDSAASHAGRATAHAHGGEPTASEIASAGPDATPPRAAHDGHAPSGEHTMAWMTCVLALLAAVIAFVAAAGLRSERLRGLLSRTRPFSWSVVAHALPPPSLTVLCIRRT